MEQMHGRKRERLRQGMAARRIILFVLLIARSGSETVRLRTRTSAEFLQRFDHWPGRQARPNISKCRSSATLRF